MALPIQKLASYGLGNLRSIFKCSKDIGFVPVTGPDSPFDSTFAKSIMKSISDNEDFPKKNSTITFYTTPAAQVNSTPQDGTISDFSAGRSIQFSSFLCGGKTVVIDGKLKESISEFCNMPNAKLGSLNQQNIAGIGKLEKGKDLYIFAHSLGMALSMPFLYQSLASGNFGRVILVIAGGYCLTDDVAILGDPITEWAQFESPGYAVLPGKVFRACFSTGLWYMNPFSLHNLGFYHAVLQGNDARFFNIANGAKYPEQKKRLASELKQLKF